MALKASYAAGDPVELNIAAKDFASFLERVNSMPSSSASSGHLAFWAGADNYCMLAMSFFQDNHQKMARFFREICGSQEQTSEWLASGALGVAGLVVFLAFRAFFQRAAKRQLRQARNELQALKSRMSRQVFDESAAGRSSAPDEGIERRVKSHYVAGMCQGLGKVIAGRQGGTHEDHAVELLSLGQCLGGPYGNGGSATETDEIHRPTGVLPPILLDTPGQRGCYPSVSFEVVLIEEAPTGSGPVIQLDGCGHSLGGEGPADVLVVKAASVDPRQHYGQPVGHPLFVESKRGASDQEGQDDAGHGKPEALLSPSRQPALDVVLVVHGPVLSDRVLLRWLSTSDTGPLARYCAPEPVQEWVSGPSGESVPQDNDGVYRRRNPCRRATIQRCHGHQQQKKRQPPSGNNRWRCLRPWNGEREAF